MIASALLVASFALHAIQVSSETIRQDPYGVPHILAASWGDAYEAQGYAVARDRLWQMENSRRLAQGKMAEVFGAAYVDADRATLRLAYAPEEVEDQLYRLSPKAKEAFQRYAAGVNRWIAEAKATAKLPSEYRQNSFEPAPWTEVDSAAIAIQMAQRFGGGGAGELRNLAFYQYMVGRVGANRVLDVVDDFLFRSDRAALPTTHETKPFPSIFGGQGRKVLEDHLKKIPKPNLLELAPALTLAERTETNSIAQQVGALSYTGSYAIVVGKERSKLGFPLLLSAPQMGFSRPSVIHECSLQVGDRYVAGMNVPGVPGVIIGHTNDFAWGLTTGVMDAADIFVSPIDGDGYRYGKEKRPLVSRKLELKIKDAPAQVVEQQRTHYGPVLLKSNSTKSIFSRASTWWGRELESFQSLFDYAEARTAADAIRLTNGLTVGFNFFFATRSGEIGWRFCGITPVRSPLADPRFPTPGDPEHDWRGTRDAASLVTVLDPQDGLIVNWNNKPTPWWENADTPAWGAIFRNRILADQLRMPKIGIEDIELAAWKIARAEEDGAFLMPFIREALKTKPDEPALRYLAAYDGLAFAGSIGARIYRAVVQATREELFLTATGNMLSMDLFNQAAQPSVMLKALNGKTQFDYLAKRKPVEIVGKAIDTAIQRLKTNLGADLQAWRFVPGSIGVAEGPAIPYSNRGSYIQIIELAETVRGRNVLPPGVAESGPHANDQVGLARAWLYKPMRMAPKP